MSDIERRVRGDWIAIREAAKRADDTAEALGLSREELIAQIEPLRLSVEGGAVEYKREQMRHAFHALDSARFKTLDSHALETIELQFARIVYVAAVQRLFAERTLKPRQAKPAEPPPQMEQTSDVNEIIREIQQRVTNDPAARNEQPVKNILMLVSRYRRELDELKSFTARANRNSAAAAAANFKRSSGEIFESIKRNYSELHASERQEAAGGPSHVMLRFDLAPLTKRFFAQAQFASRLRSTVTAVRETQYGIREALVELAGHEFEAMGLLDEEERAYAEITGSEETGRELACAFAHEVARITERDTSWTP